MRKYMSKRQRPCDFCRARKTACRIDASPPCRLCQLHGKDCTFVEAARPRKKQELCEEMTNQNSEGQNMDATVVSALVTQAGSEPSDFVPINSPLTEDNQSLPDMNMQFFHHLDIEAPEYQFMFRTPGSPGSGISLGRGFRAASMNTPTWPSTESCNNLFDDTGVLNPETLGLSGDMDPFLLQRYKTDDKGVFEFKQLAIHSVHQDAVPVQFLISQQTLFARSREEAGHEVAKESELKALLEAEIPEAMGKRLISLFQKFIAPQYPIFSTELPPDPSATPSHLLAAIYSIVFPFVMHDDQLCIDMAYDSPPYEPLSRIINASLASEMHSPSMALVQTLLLAVSRPSSNPRVSDASYRWSMLGMLVSAAVNIGLHLDPLAWKISSSKIAQRRRISFTIFATDKWLAASLGRPPHINEDNWLVTSLREGDQLGSGLANEQWNEVLEFSSLTSVLASTLSGLYSLRAVNTLMHNPQIGLDAAKTVIQALNPNNGNTSGTPSIFCTILTLGHHYTILLALRAAIRPYLTDPGGVEASHVESREHLRMGMKNHVSKFLAFISGLMIDHVNGFWPPWCQAAFSSLCFTQLLMAASSPTREEAASWVGILQQTRRQLLLKSSSFPVLSLGLLRIDSIFWRGVNNVLKLERHVADAFDAPQSD